MSIPWVSILTLAVAVGLCGAAAAGDGGDRHAFFEQLVHAAPSGLRSAVCDTCIEVAGAILATPESATLPEIQGSLTHHIGLCESVETRFDVLCHMMMERYGPEILAHGATHRRHVASLPLDEQAAHAASFCVDLDLCHEDDSGQVGEEELHSVAARAAAEAAAAARFRSLFHSIRDARAKAAQLNGPSVFSGNARVQDALAELAAKREAAATVRAKIAEDAAAEAAAAATAGGRVASDAHGNSEPQDPREKLLSTLAKLDTRLAENAAETKATAEGIHDILAGLLADHEFVLEHQDALRDVQRPRSEAYAAHHEDL